MKTFKLGEIELKDIFCADHLLSIGFEVEKIPDSLLETVQQSIEEEKAACGWCNSRWSDKPVIVDYHVLSISFSPDSPIEYQLQTTFHDAENEKLEGCGTAYLDLSEYDGYVKQIISDWLFNKFFKVKENMFVKSVDNRTNV